jgi:uncharacterized repeat protein (TIGR03803 family)
VFELTPGAKGWTHSVLHDFTGAGDGAEISGGLIRDTSGNLYGTTQLGGTSGEGTIFRMDTAGNKTVLHNFSGPDGAYPYAGLTADAAGNFYGTTAYGGSGEVGTVFELNVAGNLTTLHTFTGGSDGAYPEGSLLLQNGVLYGVTTAGGSSNKGTIFQLSLSGIAPLQYDVSLYQFNSKPYGQVTVNTVGVTTIQLNGATPNTIYSVQFCPAPAQLYPNCLTVGFVTTNATGAANSNVIFPSGQWAGDFALSLNGTQEFTTSFFFCCSIEHTGPSQVYYATLRPQSTVNGEGTWTQESNPPPQDPLQSGYIQMQPNGLLFISLTGATPNRQYGGAQCPLYQGSDCYGFGGNLTTNSAGDTTSTSSEGTSIPEDIFYIDDNSNLGYGYIAGFSIP